MRKLIIDWKLMTLLLINVLYILYIQLDYQNSYIKTKHGIKEHGEFAICEIKLFATGTLRSGGSLVISYHYKDKHHAGDIVGPNYSIPFKVGEKYIVMFDSTNLKRCVVLDDYPVKDSLQFLKDVEYLKKNPPTPFYESLIWDCLKDKA